jgi:hypothetical protein
MPPVVSQLETIFIFRSFLSKREMPSVSPFSNLETNDGTLITNGDAGLFA